MNQAEKGKWNGRSKGGSLGHSIFIFIIKYLGLRVAYVLLFFVSIYFVPFAPKATKAIWFYYRQILKKSFFSSIYYLFRHYYIFGQIIIDKFAIQSGSNRFSYEFENYDNFIATLESKEALIIIGAHIGCWEIGSKFFDKYGKLFNIVMLDNEYQKIKDVIEREKECNYKILPLTEDSLENILNIKRVLNKKEYVCFQGDRYMNDNVLEVDFMGQPALFPSGPFLLASKLKTKVIFYYAMRKRNYKYKFYFLEAEPIQSNKIVTKNIHPEQDLLNQYTKSLESILDEYPSQWFNFYKFWK